MPTNSGCVSLITLLPSIVAAIGMPAPSAKRQQSVLQAEAVDLHAGDDHRPLAGGDAARGLGHGLGQARRDRWPAPCATGVCGPSGTTSTMSRGSSM